MDVLGENEALQQFFDGETDIMSQCDFLLNITANISLYKTLTDGFEVITPNRSFFNIFLNAAKMFAEMCALLFLCNSQQSLVLLHQLFTQSVIKYVVRIQMSKFDFWILYESSYSGAITLS